MTNLYRYYAGIGSRKTPDTVLEVMQNIGHELARFNWVLRSGGAVGADSAFENGCDLLHGQKQVFIPWAGFNGRKFRDGAVIPFATMDLQERAERIAASFHPAWHKCSSGAKSLHMRNVAQVLGPDLETPSSLVVCWTPEGKLVGGTAQAIRIAEAHGIPVFNLGLPNIEQTLDELAIFANTFSQG